MLEVSHIDSRTREFLSRFSFPTRLLDSEAVDRLYRQGREAVDEGRLVEAEILFRQSVEGATTLEDSQRATRARLELAPVLVETRAPIACANVLHELEGADLTPSERAKWHLLMGHLLRGFSRYRLADSHFRHAERTSGELQDDRFAGYALVERGSLRSVVGSTREATGCFEKGLSILSRASRRVASIVGSINLAANLIHAGETDRAVRELERASSLQGENPSPRFSGLVDLHLAEIAILESEADLARELSLQVERSIARSGIEVLGLHTFVLRTILDREADPQVVVDDLGATARRLRNQGLYQESGMFSSLAAVLGERHGLPGTAHRVHAREVLGNADAAEEFDVHHGRLYDAVDRRRRRARSFEEMNGAVRGIEGREIEDLRDDGTVLLLSRQERVARRLRAAVPAERPVTILRDWPRLRALASTASVAVVVEPSLTGAVVRRRISDLKRAFPFLPLVVVTEREAENVRHLTELEVDEIVWLSRPGTIATAIPRAISGSLLRRLARTFASCEGLDPILRRALARLCVATRPVTGVAELADAVGRHRTTLARAWKREAEGIPWRLQDVVAWILLLRAVGQKSPDRSWNQVAHDLGVHVQTLRGYAERLRGKGLAEIDAEGSGPVVTGFLDEIVDPLTGRG